MGFSGGGAGVLTNHTHDSAVPTDGGALAANATQFGLTNGSLLVSDGTNIQELGVGASGYVLGTAAGTIPTWEASAASIVMTVNGQMVYYDGSRTALDIGNTDDVLTVSGGLPVWSAPTGAAWEQVFTDTLTGATNEWTNTFTAIPQDDYAMFCLQIQAGFSDDSDILLQFHNDAGVITSGYYSDGIKITGGAATYLNDDDVDWARVLQQVGHSSYGITIFMTMGNSTFALDRNQRFSWWSTGSTGSGGARGFSSQGGTCSEDPITSLDGITLYANAVAGLNTFSVGCKATLWKIS